MIRRILAAVLDRLLAPPDFEPCRWARETHLGLTEEDR